MRKQGLVLAGASCMMMLSVARLEAGNCSGHADCDVDWEIRAEPAIKVRATIMVEDGPGAALRPGATPVKLGAGCIRKIVTFHVEGSDPDNHICEVGSNETVLGTVANYMAPTEIGVGVYLANETGEHRGAKVTTIGLTRNGTAVRYEWDGTWPIAEALAGNWIWFEYEGQVDDSKCPEHPKSDESPVDMSAYKATLALTAVETVVKDGTSDEGPLYVCIHSNVVLRAVPKPANGGWPKDEPWWKVASAPGGGSLTIESLEPDLVRVKDFTAPGEYEIESGTCNGSDTVTVVAYEVESIDVIPKGVPPGYELPDPVCIGAGGIESDAHQADVTIKVLPRRAGIPVPVWLENGIGHEINARFVADGVSASGGGEAVEMRTDGDGEIDAVLTSSDSLDLCTIHACCESALVEFEWDKVEEEGEWTTEPDLLPVPGALRNRLRLRHHRKEALDAPWAPLDRHGIRMFVEQVEYWDEEGNLQTLVNTEDNPSDLSGWAEFPEASKETDGNGEVQIVLNVKNRSELYSVLMAAYDWSVWRLPGERTALGAVRLQAPARRETGDRKDYAGRKDEDREGLELKAPPAVRRRYGENDPGGVTTISVRAPAGKKVDLEIKKAGGQGGGEATFADGETTMTHIGTGQAVSIPVLGKVESTEVKDLEITAQAQGGGAPKSARFIVFSEYVSDFKCGVTQHKDTAAVCTKCDGQAGVTQLHRHEPVVKVPPLYVPCDHKTIINPNLGTVENCDHCLHYCLRCCASVLYGGNQDDYIEVDKPTVEQNHRLDLVDFTMMAHVRARGHVLVRMATVGKTYEEIYRKLQAQERFIGTIGRHYYIVHGCRLNDSVGGITPKQMACWEPMFATSQNWGDFCEVIYPEAQR